MKKKESLLLGRLLQKIAPLIGASVFIEPEWGIAGQITFKNGKVSYFRYNTLDLNPVGSSDIAKDKDYAYFFMKRMGYSVVPQSKTFFSPSWGKAIGAPQRGIDAGYRYAQTLGFPVIVKPNSGSQGVGVALVYTRREFYRAMRSVFTTDRVALVQQFVTGRDYRLVVLDTEVISAYERMPLSVVGNGTSTIAQLLKTKQRQFQISKRDTRIHINDPRIVTKLQHQGCTLESVLPRGQKIFLLDNANLSSGGDAVDVTKEVHPEFKKLAVALTRDMGLRLCGVDVIVEGDITKQPKNFWILEINSAPGLDHYVKMGTKQESIVADLYLQVLRHMER